MQSVYHQKASPLVDTPIVEKVDKKTPKNATKIEDKAESMADFFLIPKHQVSKRPCDPNVALNIVPKNSGCAQELAVPVRVLRQRIAPNLIEEPES